MKVPETTPEMFPGVLGELIEATAGVTEAHPAAVAIQFLTGLGNVIGRDAHTYVGETRHGLNLNVLVIGPTATGRKGDAWNVARLALEGADPAWAGLIASGLHSGEGLIAAVRDEMRGVKNGKEIVIDPGVPDKRFLAVQTEFSQPLKLFAQPRNILSNVIRDAWDGKHVLRQMVKNSPLRATGAHISIIGHTTPEDLHAYLSTLDVANGTGNRFLMIACDRVRSIANPPRLAEAVQKRLVRQVQTILTHAKGIKCIRRTPRASELWENLYPDLSEGRPGLIGTLLARGPANVTRLSTLFTLLNRTCDVDLPDLTAAAAWWDYHVQSVEIIFAGRTGNDAADRIKAEMLPGESLTRSEIREKIFSNHIGSGSLYDALELLRELGLVQLSVRTGTGGRAAVVVTRLDPDSTKERAA
jgi:hypothetical protein